MHSLKQICINTLNHWKEISIVYLAQLVLGLVVASVFFNEMSYHLNQSMAIDHLGKGFDRTVLTDLIYSTDDFLGKTKIVGFCVLVAYLFIGAFLQAGWLANIRKQKFEVSSLFRNGSKYIVPFLGIAFISFFIIALIGGLIAFLFTKAVGDPLVTFSSEKPYVIWIVCLSILFIIWLVTVWSWSVISRCHYIDGQSFFTSLKSGLLTLGHQWYKFQAIGLLMIGIHVVFMFLYYWIMGDRGAPVWGVVLFGIFIQQVFNYFRIVLRGLGYSLVEDLI